MDARDVELLLAANLPPDILVNAAIMLALRRIALREASRMRHSRVVIEMMDNVAAYARFRFDINDLRRLSRRLGFGDTFKTKHRVSASGVEALAVVCSRLAYPNRWCDEAELFGRSESSLQAIFMDAITELDANWSDKLQFVDFDRVGPRFPEYAAGIADRGALLPRCVGFVDGTFIPICRPSEGQQEVYRYDVDAVYP